MPSGPRDSFSFCGTHVHTLENKAHQRLGPDLSSRPRQRRDLGGMEEESTRLEIQDPNRQPLPVGTGTPTALSGPPTACCWTAVKHTGDPKGRIEPLGGLDTYISELPENLVPGPHKKVLLFFADAYGPLFINNKLLQDHLPRGPRIHRPRPAGVPVQNLPPDRDKVAWAWEALPAAMKVLPKRLKDVRVIYGIETTKYVADGYCFGAPFVLDLAAEGSIIASAIAHPGFLNDSHFQKLNIPMLLSCAENDAVFPLEARRRAEHILISNKSTSRGFAVRGDPNVPHAGQESARGITDWFILFTT